MRRVAAGQTHLAPLPYVIRASPRCSEWTMARCKAPTCHGCPTAYKTLK